MQNCKNLQKHKHTYIFNFKLLDAKLFNNILPESKKCLETFKQATGLSQVVDKFDIFSDHLR